MSFRQNRHKGSVPGRVIRKQTTDHNLTLFEKIHKLIYFSYFYLLLQGLIEIHILAVVIASCLNSSHVLPALVLSFLPSAGHWDNDTSFQHEL